MCAEAFRVLGLNDQFAGLLVWIIRQNGRELSFITNGG
jgi:hypothetical protein